MKTPNGSADVVVRLFSEAANENERFSELALVVSLSEGAHASDSLWAYLPLPGFGQAADSTERGFLQALAPDPMLWPLTVIGP
jgi:hypothetical protein